MIEIKGRILSDEERISHPALVAKECPFPYKGAVWGPIKWRKSKNISMKNEEIKQLIEDRNFARRALANVVANYMDIYNQRRLKQDYPEYFEIMAEPRTTTEEEIQEMIRKHQQ